MRKAVFLLCFSFGLTGCAEFPELESAISDRGRAAGYPALLPMEDLLARANAPTRLDETTGAGLAARAAALRARADRLRRMPVVDAAARRRMLAAVARHGA